MKASKKSKEAPWAGQKYLVVVNPVSRGGKALSEAVWLLKRLRDMGIEHEDFFTEKAGHAEEIVRRLINTVDVVVAVGGDGTVNEVVNGMLSGGGSEKTLAVFPAGTADDFCHNVGIPRKRKEAMEVLLGGEHKRIDLIEYNQRYAAVTVGIGIDAEIAYAALKHKRARIPAYFYVGLRIAFIERMKKSPKSLLIKNENHRYEGKYLIAVFGNGSLFGRFVYFLPDAKMDDGKLNMTALQPISPVPGFLLFLRCFKQGYKSDRLIYDAGRSFKVDIQERAFMQVDGEVYQVEQGEQLDIKVKSRALNVRVSPGNGYSN